MLIQQKANVCSTSDSQQTALHFAAKMEHMGVVPALLNAALKRVCLFGAGWLALVKMLIQQKANVCSVCSSRQTALHFAAEMGHVEVVAALLDAAGKELIVMKDQGNWTPLHHAAEQGSVDIVELLICVRLSAQFEQDLI